MTPGPSRVRRWSADRDPGLRRPGGLRRTRVRERVRLALAHCAVRGRALSSRPAIRVEPWLRRRVALSRDAGFGCLALGRGWAHTRRRSSGSGVPVMKSALAAVLAYVAAGPLPGPASVLAPLTALLVIQSTLYETLTSGLQRVASVLAGVLVALMLSTLVGLTWWSLGLVVLASLLIAQRLRLGSQLMEVPISAMLVLAVASHTDAAVNRVDETLIGAAVGVLVKVLTPPLYVQSAGDAIGELAEQISRLLRDVGSELEQAWTYERAERWLGRARDLPRPVQQARDALVRGERSLRLNPRGRRAAHAPESLLSGLTALEHTAIHVRVLCRSLADRVHGLADEDLPVVPVRWSLAWLLDSAGAAVAAFGRLVSADLTGPPQDRAALREALDRAHYHWDAAAELLLVDAQAEPAVWQVHGALLAHVHRLLQEIDPDTDRAAIAVFRPEAPPRRLPRLRLPTAERGSVS